MNSIDFPSFLDYTSFGTFLEITSKSGSSPFKFDDINDDLKINLNLNQQIIKSLSFGISSYLNIDKDSYNFNKFINTCTLYSFIIINYIRIKIFLTICI